MVPLKLLLSALMVACVLWAAMFSPFTAPHLNFWALMTFSALILTCFASLGVPRWWQRLHFSAVELAIGAAIAGGLWGAFLLGDQATAFLFDFARPEVSAIYGIKDGISPWVLSLLLVGVIGPAEEVFWRGFVQEQLSRRWNANVGFMAATALYTAVHLPACNMMLTLAALVAGASWGICYRLFPGHFTAIILSHALWDAAVFVWFPIC